MDKGANDFGELVTHVGACSIAVETVNSVAVLLCTIMGLETDMIQAYATEVLGLSQQARVNLIIITNVLGIPNRPTLGYLADRYAGPLNCLIPCVALRNILIFAWVAVHTVAELYVFAVFYGTSSAAALIVAWWFLWEQGS